MRTSVLLLAVLAFQASADVSVNGASPKKLRLLKAAAAPAATPAPAPPAATPAPAPPAATPAPAPPAATPAPAIAPPAPVVPVPAAVTAAPAPVWAAKTTQPWTKYVGPIVGGTVGAAALAGVITLSVMKHPTVAPAAKLPAASAAGAGAPPPVSFKAAAAAGAKKPTPAPVVTSTLSTAVAAGARSLAVASQDGFAVGARIVLGAGTPEQEFNSIAAFGSLILKDALKFNHTAGVAISTAPVAGDATAAVSSGLKQGQIIGIAGGLVFCGLLAVCVVCLMHVCGGKNKKKRAKKINPREENMIPEDQMPLNQSVLQTKTDLPGFESQYMPALPPLNGSAYAATPSVYATPSAYAGLGSVPTMQNINIPMQTMPPPPPMFNQNMSVFSQNPMQGGGSAFMPASPLANTVNALPTTAFMNTGGMPTQIYG